MDVTLLRPVRNFLGLTLQAVAGATGVRADRLSEGERGLTQLQPAELTAVCNFLRERLAGERAIQHALGGDE